MDMGRIVKGIKDSCPSGGLSRKTDQAMLKAYQARVRKLYVDVVCITRSKRNEFLRLLVRAFKGDKGLVGTDSSEINPTLCCWLAVLLSGLPYKKGDEVCLILREIDAITASKISTTVAELHELLEGDGNCYRRNHQDEVAAGGRHPVVPKAMALCILIRLKVYLMQAYNINAERLALYSSEKAEKASEKDNAVQFSRTSVTDDVEKRMHSVYGIGALSIASLLDELDDDMDLL